MMHIYQVPEAHIMHALSYLYTFVARVDACMVHVCGAQMGAGMHANSVISL